MATTTSFTSNYTPMGVQEIPREVTDFIENFYRVSDTPGQDTEWVAFFTATADLIMRNKRSSGEADIMQMRQGMWEAVEARKHKVEKIFPTPLGSGEDGNAPLEFMLFGSVWYRLKGGEEKVVDWAGHAVVVRPTEGWRFKSYRVYLQQ